MSVLDGMYGALSLFEDRGWKIDYSELTMAANVIIGIERLEIDHLFKFLPEDNLLAVNHTTYVPYLFTEDMLSFLRFVQEELVPHCITFAWQYDGKETPRMRPALFVGWKAECAESDHIPTVEYQLDGGQRFLHSCVHVLNVYERVRRQRKQLPRHMNPVTQSEFCRLGFNEGEVLFDD